MGLCFLALLILVELHDARVVSGEVAVLQELGRSDRLGSLKSPASRSDFGDNPIGPEDREAFCRDLEACFLSGFCSCGAAAAAAAGERSPERIALELCVHGRLLCDDRIACNGFPFGFAQALGRKILMDIDEKAPEDGELIGEKQYHSVSLPGYNISLAIPGMFLMCCAICPCFRVRRKDASEDHVLASELSQVNSVSSSEAGLIFERFPASPFRFPGSPTSERIPGSPRKVPASPSRFLMSPQLNRMGSIHLSTSQIMKATRNFSPSLKLGEGGFGTVYKAALPDGQVVAIKRAKKEHIASLRDEFSNEVELLAKIDHRNLVKLLAYSDKGNERIIITEYVRNGTLREHLDGIHGKILDFNQRLEISIDVAHGLTYLHMYAEKTIIHRDVKSSNILLTENFRAKVSDFGFARFGPAADQTHIMTKIKGTAGYLDPEYLKTYQLTPKSDVFSFGILLLEILSARRPVEPKRDPDDRILVRWAFRLYNEGRLREIVDPLLIEMVDGEVLEKILGLAFQCSAPTRPDRPSMKEVGEQLWEIRRDHHGQCRSRE